MIDAQPNSGCNTAAEPDWLYKLTAFSAG